MKLFTNKITNTEIKFLIPNILGQLDFISAFTIKVLLLNQETESYYNQSNENQGL